MSIAENKGINLGLRGLQLLFAIIVLGTDGYSIHVARDTFFYSDFGYYYGAVPSSWAFLMFAAVWTILIGIFLLIGSLQFADHPIGHPFLRLGLDALTMLFWFAGFIAVATTVTVDTCHGYTLCGTVKASAVFGAFEWLLFAATTALAVLLVLGHSRGGRKSTPANPVNAGV